VVNVVVEILLIHNSHNVVDIIIIHRQPGKSGVGESLSDLGFRRIERNADDVDTRSKDLCGLHLHEADCILNQIAFLVVDVALLGRLLDDGHQFLIGDAVVFRGFEDAGEQLLPLGKEKRHRGQHDHQNVEKRCGKFGDRLRRFFCNAFRGNFAEDQDHDSGYDRGNRRTGVAAEKLDKKHRGNGAESDVDDVVADENRGEQLVKVLQQL